MVIGLTEFKKWFAGYGEQYVIIGGTACDLLMSENELNFRSTKDIDLVLIVESLTPEFGERFWEYILNGGYEFLKKSTSAPQFYRFEKPKKLNFPTMIELFSKKTNFFPASDDANITSLYISDDVSSLSAILLNSEYYALLIKGRVSMNGLTILDAPYLILFKMKAWLDLKRQKENGNKINSRDIKKHKNDVFRLTRLLSEHMMIEIPEMIHTDFSIFITKMDNENIDLQQLGITRQSKQNLLDLLVKIYILVE